MTKNIFITIAGNIGVGKSSLTKILASAFGWTPVFEPHSDNPFLADFYKNMNRWGFHSQIFFLSKRLQQHYDLLQLKSSVIQDRSVYEDAEIFAQNLYLQKHLPEREWQTYLDMYKTLTMLLDQPDLIVYLQASVPTLLTRITKRGREYEKNISPNYLMQLNDLYKNWASSFALCPMLTIDTDKLDFVQDKQQLQVVLQMIKGQLPDMKL